MHIKIPFDNALYLSSLSSNLSMWGYFLVISARLSKQKYTTMSLQKLQLVIDWILPSYWTGRWDSPPLEMMPSVLPDLKFHLPAPSLQRTWSVHCSQSSDCQDPRRPAPACWSSSTSSRPPCLNASHIGPPQTGNRGRFQRGRWTLHFPDLNKSKSQSCRAYRNP